MTCYGHAMALRVVIDSNRLQSIDLRAFLQVSPDNFAVLTDYAWIEAYKGNSLVSIQKSMGVLKDFPERVIVLKSTRAICRIEPSPSGMGSAMARKGHEFRQTVTGLLQAEAGDPGAIAQIIAHGESADRQMAKLLTDVFDLPVVFQEMLRTFFTREEIVHIRAGKPYTPEFVRKVLEVADALAETFYRRHPDRPRLPHRRARFHGFIYRHALAALLYFLRWVREGSPLEKAAKKVRNDIVDLSFATYGTFFNGVMTDDAKVRELHMELRVVLGETPARMPPEYPEGFAKQIEEIVGLT